MIRHSGPLPQRGVYAAVKAELFPARVRALGVAPPYALADALFGGTAEYVALAVPPSVCRRSGRVARTGWCRPSRWAGRSG